MYITRVVIKNYRCLSGSDIELNPSLNIIVGDNECGKSTLLEAIHLALSGQLNGRPIQTELHPYLFNANAVRSYIAALIGGKRDFPPSILIELYLADHVALSKLKGRNNSLKKDVPGVKLLIEFNEGFKAEYIDYIKEPKPIRTVPVEHYIVRWRDFADNDVTARSIPLKPSFIDASTLRNSGVANRYVLDVVKDSLTREEQVGLALTYRQMKDRFLAEPKVAAINAGLAAKKGTASEKAITVSLDSSSRASWELGVMPHLDDIPMTLVGKGEQSSVKIKLALDNGDKSHLFLIEEAENHLSFSNLANLINHIATKRVDRQLLITTHSSYVMNKLGVDAVLMFKNGIATKLTSLTPKTRDYFLKLPGYDTLRLVLSKRAILVEGPSDELVVQKAFHRKHGKMPLEAGVDVISVSSLAFKRFLEIADVLKIKVDVVTDNDGSVAKLKEKYKDYLPHGHISIQFDPRESDNTLEPQLLAENGRQMLNDILGKSYATDAELLRYMESNKTEVALKLFETDKVWKVPEYIQRAIQ
ncbi:AAA family ATPase [Rhizobium daejeonense]|uniref:AAA family ATPase n=1 Tax=Rhizobium daejeonense TaxID=240521 RepID=A0A6M1S0A7_9HYPH|nr:AAA family ATPase [Rhizobium daejeonense]NGO62480.1 AAA family ATPase [Rhizobium daejeonense]